MRIRNFIVRNNYCGRQLHFPVGLKKVDFANRIFANKKYFLVEKKSRPPFPRTRRPLRALVQMGVPIGKYMSPPVVRKAACTLEDED